MPVNAANRAALSIGMRVFIVGFVLGFVRERRRAVHEVSIAFHGGVGRPSRKKDQTFIATDARAGSAKSQPEFPGLA